MKKVMLIGDSIRIGYQDKVRQLLSGRAEVNAPAENCRFASYTLFSLSSWVPGNDYDVIQWNNGQWDTCYMPDGRIHTPLAVYLDLEKRIATILKKKGKRLIFATTTPVWPDQYATSAVNPRKNEDIREYNKAVAAALSGMGVEIVDLYAPLIDDVKKYISEDKVHLSPAGVDRCAELISSLIMQ